ncbi:DEAD/DEAH box helicase family protein [Pelagibacterium sp. 26DY04]|uniref:DEAD/DEAH box helicase n=1 Tax=Pelagibacterium sp. 26DY04 TaxID=2967130 RepID=UPI002815B7C1|nr:DEAD/DEAH box helicase family protein [Pelagibacterium sp. 26DY04]WMT85586.1 DEAD/DEAH box helicase family protein [Pelagibacterium sp. 26DY04]
MILFEPKQIELRPYQENGIERLRDGVRRGLRRQVFVSPTGSGKTETAIKLILEAIGKGSRVWFIVDRVTLVDQTMARFDPYGIDYGVIQADHFMTDSSKQVQIVSAQTLARRSVREMPDLIVVDECHARYKSTIDLIERASEAKVIGLTATPFTAGMADEWDGLVNSITVNELIKQKFLAPLKIKACVTPDMKDAKKTFTGEYEEEDAGQRGITIIGDVVQTWVSQTAKHFGGPVKTIVFSPSVKHGAELCRQFAEAGYNFQQISYLDNGTNDRKDKIAEFRKPDSAIDGLVSCEVLTKGFDVPDVLCGISCRPYRKSFSNHIQEMGRVMRIAPGKDFGLWLDHSGNCISFADDTAWLYEYGVDSLSSAQKKDSEVREPTEKTKHERFCGECSAQMEPGSDTCQECGWERPQRGEIQIVQGELIDLEISTKEAYQPRKGLRADCLKSPRSIWNAALAYTHANSRKGADHARRWAFGVWKGIYPGAKLPRGLYDAPYDASKVSPDEYSLIEREIARFRKGGARKAA